jgi:hypothetical protein
MGWIRFHMWIAVRLDISRYGFFLEYIKDLHIIIIKKEYSYTNDTLLTSVLEGHTAVS